MATITPKFRASYPQLFEPKQNQFNKKMEYSVQALFPKGADLSGLKKAALEAIEEKWGKDKTKWKNLKYPFRDQADLAKEDAETGKVVQPPGTEAGAYYLRLSSTNRPGVVDENVQDILETGDFYGGCWARATVHAYAYDTAGNKGVTFYLNNIQKVGDGEPFGRGRNKPEEDFSPIEGMNKKDFSGSADDLFG